MTPSQAIGLRRAPPTRWSSAFEGVWSERMRLFLLLGFLGLVCLTGGSARANVPGLLALRPVAAVVLTALLCMPASRSWGALRPLAWLLAAWAVVIAVQLVPLPPAIWTTLPGRDRYLTGIDLIGPRPWHAVALFPDRAWSALLDLMMPAIVLFAFRDLRDDQRDILLPTLFVIALLCALLGVAQMSGGPGSIFYLYGYATQDSPVGFFANRNHEAVFLATTLPLLRAWTLWAPSPRVMRTRLWVAAMLAVLSVGAALVTGSRAGFVMLAIGIAGAIAIRPPSLQGHGRGRALLVTVGVVLALVLLGATFAASGRLPALSRLMVFASDDELRFRYLPILSEMVSLFFPVGSGFGSFEPLFRSVEPDTALKFTFFNNAHNDLIEVTITGGAPALAIVVAAVAWWARTTLRAFGEQARPTVVLARASGWSIGMVLLASLVDYPLRTPLFATVATLWFCWLAVGREERAREVIAPQVTAI